MPIKLYSCHFAQEFHSRIDVNLKQERFHGVVIDTSFKSIFLHMNHPWCKLQALNSERQTYSRILSDMYYFDPRPFCLIERSQYIYSSNIVQDPATLSSNSVCFQVIVFVFTTVHRSCHYDFQGILQSLTDYISCKNCSYLKIFHNNVTLHNISVMRMFKLKGTNHQINKTIDEADQTDKTMSDSDQLRMPAIFDKSWTNFQSNINRFERHNYKQHQLE